MSHEGSFSLDSDAEPVNRRLASFVCIFFEFIVNFLSIVSFSRTIQGPSARHISRRLKNLRWSRFAALCFGYNWKCSFCSQAAWPFDIFAHVLSNL
jgi:hypothetical protein